MDMMRGRNGVAALAKEVMLRDPFGKALFAFIGRKFDTLKVWGKVIEGKARYARPRHLQDEGITLTVQQLKWLLEGCDVWKMKAHSALDFSHVS